MSGICDTCKRDECYMQHDGDDSCPLYMKGSQSNYKKLFGTPERAARTLRAIPCGSRPCSECPIAEPCLDGRTNPNAMLEWLRDDV